MTLLTVTALGGSALAVMTVMTALGADEGQVALLFLSEAALIGLTGGAAGYALGLGLAKGLARTVFSAGADVPAVVLPITLLLAMAVALLGSALPVRQAMRLDPVRLLRGK